MRKLRLVSALLALSLLSSACDSPSAQNTTRTETPSPEITVPALAPPATPLASDAGAAGRHDRLARVRNWFYYLKTDLDDDVWQRIVDSGYDMVVIDPIFTEAENSAYPTADLINRLHEAEHPKLVIAYIDIGQAEDYRTYWQEGWEIGDPDWIVALDPDGWEGNFPVAYWRDEWGDIWLGETGIMQALIDAGFDGVYLDWVEAYSDENVIFAAEQDGIDPVAEMKRWVADMAAFGRAQKPDLIVIAQNAAELAAHDDYLSVIDAIAQEQVWFDGGAEDRPPGDCPLPRTEAEVDSQAYFNQLPPDCKSVYRRYPESSLHTSSEWYLNHLKTAHDKGKVIFTVDYALEPENVAWVYRTARNLGFIPFVTERGLSIYLEPTP